MADDRTKDELRDRPIGELLKQLSQETTTLVRQELELAKAEMAQKGSRPASARACSAVPALRRCSVSAR
jgi:hypothetical protein